MYKRDGERDGAWHPFSLLAEAKLQVCPRYTGHMCISYLPPDTLITHLTQRHLCLGAHQ